MSWASEFKEFAVKGNVVDLAVGVIIGAAFGKIVASVTDDLIMPVIGALVGGLDFSSYFLALAPVPAGLTGLAQVKAAGVPVFAYGHFITEVINFLIIAWIIFLIVRTANHALNRQEKAEPEVVEAAEIVLLREIRDELKTTPRSATPAA